MKHTTFAKGNISTRISCDMEAADRPPAWSHPQQHGGFHLESFGLFLCKTRILEGQQHRAVSQTGMGEKHQTAVQGFSEFGPS